MKKTILLGTLLFVLHCSYSFANEKDKGISERVKSSFRHQFVTAEEVQWEELQTCVRANFKMWGQVLSAYFGPEGDLLAVTRNISIDQATIL
jgi:hypothetical protein